MGHPKKTAMYFGLELGNANIASAKLSNDGARGQNHRYSAKLTQMNYYWLDLPD